MRTPPRWGKAHVFDATGRDLVPWPIRVANLLAPGDQLRLPNDSRALVNGRGLLWTVLAIASDRETRELLVLATPARGRADEDLIAEIDHYRTNTDNLERAFAEMEARSGERGRRERVRLALRIASPTLGELVVTADLLIGASGTRVEAMNAARHPVEAGLGPALRARLAAPARRLPLQHQGRPV